MADDTQNDETEGGTQESSRLYVAREEDLATLKAAWQTARGGKAQVVQLTAPLGGGKRALVGELCRAAAAESDDVVIWRVSLQDEEDGLQTLIRIYAALLSGLHRNRLLRGRVEMAINAQIPGKTPRVQRWYQAFIEGLKKGAPKPGEDKFEVSLPRDNPLIGVVEIAHAISRKFPVVMELQGLHNVQSLAVHAMIEALIARATTDEENHLLAILAMEPLSGAAKDWMSLPLLDMLERRRSVIISLEMSDWTAEDVEKYLASKKLSSNAAEIARIAGGKPGFVAELTDWLGEEERLGDDLSELTLAGLVDLSPDEDELEEPGEGDEEKKGQRKVATAEDAERVGYLAALLGLTFPSGMIADLAGYDRDSIDDLLDATENVYKELQFSQPLGTWLYQFKRALLRESVLARHNSEEDKNVATRVAMFMERFFVPRGYGFLIKTLRLYAESGQAQRAALLRSNALTHDQPQTWAMAQDLIRYVEDAGWPAPMRRTVYMNLLERMVQSGDVQQTEGLYNEAMGWASQNQDRGMQAWLLFAGSRLDQRRQDLYRARDRANDALKMYKALGDKFKEGEVRTHLASIELADGNFNAALDQARLAEEVAPVPPMQAHAEFVRGMVARRDKTKLAQAIEHFRRANEIAGNAGNAPLALEAGLAFGEALFVSGQPSKSADVLAQVARIAQSLRNPARERAAASLLAQSHAALNNFEAAIQAGRRTLELTQSLKFEKVEAVDLYNLGFFHLRAGKPTEAVSLFKQARGKADATEQGFQRELLFNHGLALHAIGERGQALDTLGKAAELATQAKDWRKVMVAHQHMGELQEKGGNLPSARNHLQSALRAADAGDLKEDRKALRRKLDQLGG